MPPTFVGLFSVMRKFPPNIVNASSGLVVPMPILLLKIPLPVTVRIEPIETVELAERAPVTLRLLSIVEEAFDINPLLKCQVRLSVPVVDAV